MTGQRSFTGLGIMYAAGQFLLQAISFLLLPVYAGCMTVSEFGQFAITGTVSDITGFLLVMGIYSGYNRFYMDHDEAGRNRLRNTALTFSVAAGTAMAVLIGLTAGWMAALVPGIANFPEILFYMLANNLFVQIITVFTCDYLLNYKAGQVVVINLVRTLGSALLVIFFLAVRHEGIAGIYKGQAAAGSCLLLYFFIKNIKKLKLEVDRKMLVQMLKFGAGLIPSNLSASLLNFSDRFFMAGYRSFEETGIYSIGYKFGMQIDPLFTTPFRQVFTTYKYENWKDSEAGVNFNKMFLKYHIFGCFIMLCIAVLSRPAINIFMGAEYLPAYRIVPIILISYFLYGKSRFYNMGIELKNKTYLDSFILIAGGVANIGLNVALIPRLGMEGAALATLISYMLINMLYSKISGRLYRIKYDIKKPYTACGIAAALYGAYFAWSLSPADVTADIIPGVMLPLAYIFACAAFGIIDLREILGFLRLRPRKHEV